MKYLKRLLFKIFVFFFGKKDENIKIQTPTLNLFRHLVIKKVLSITAGKRHAWVETTVGRIKKPLEKIPDNLLIEYRNQIA